MTQEVVDALIVDLLNWLVSGERTYQEVIDVWRTSCPKLPVWEDANDRGLVTTVSESGCEIVRISPAGIHFLQQHRRPATSGTSRPA